MQSNIAMNCNLYRRGADTFVASWQAYARGAISASVQQLPGVTAAVFPLGPERGVYNNVLLARGLGAAARAEAVDAMESAYAASRVDRFAAYSPPGLRR